MNTKTIKNFKVLALILVTSALLLVAINPNIANVKAATQDSVYVYSVAGGSVSANGTALTGGSTVKYDNGTVLSLTATAASSYKFLGWVYLSAAGANTSTSTTLLYPVTASSCAIEPMFIPSTNTTSPTSSGSGAATIIIMTAAGGTTQPTAASYTNYTVGTVSNFTAVADSGFKFLCWNVATSSASVYTTSTLSLNVSATTCALQAIFIPTSSTFAVPEFSSAIIVVLAAVLVVSAFGTYAYTRRAKK